MSETTLAASNAANNYTLKNNEDGSFAIKKATTDVLTISATGIIQPASGQILFPSVQNPSSDVHILDDYEEGSFTPAFSATGCTFNYVIASGRYIKIGRLVSANILVMLAGSGNTLAANAVSITGLPFLSDAAGTTSICHAAWGNINTAVYSISGILQASASSISLSKITAATTLSGSPALLGTDLSAASGTYIQLSITYQADA